MNENAPIERSGAAGRAAGRWLAAALVPIALGVALRLWNLRDQVLVGDERWDLAAALGGDLGEILTQLVVSRANYAPPLSAVYRVMLEGGVALDELRLRAPVLACGVAALAIVPLSLRRWLGAPAALALCWLLALSPALVLYSRVVRGYMPLLLLTTGAVASFLVWQEARSRRAGAAFVLLAGAAAYTHLLALPIALSPFLHAGLDLALRRAGPGEWRRLLGLLLAAAAAIALFLAPVRGSLVWLVSERSASQAPGLATWGEASLRLAGAHSIPLGLLFGAAAARGLGILFRVQKGFARATLCAVAAQVGAVAILAPAGADDPALFARYVLPALPFALAWVAVGLSARLPGGDAAAVGLPAVAALAMLAASPLASFEFARGSFAHALVHRSWSPRAGGTPVPDSEPFYAYLATAARREPVIETGWHSVLFAETARVHQLVHRQPVIVSSERDAWWADARVQLRNAVGPRPSDWLASRARYAIVHLRPREEELLVQGNDAAARRALRQARSFAANVEAANRRVADCLARRWGEADHRDPWIAAWDLARVRSEGERRSAGPACE